MKFLLDTNICIYIIKKKPVNVLRRFEELTPGDIGVLSITTAELFYGVEKSSRIKDNRRALEQFLLPLTVSAFNYTSSLYYGKVRAALERSGQQIGSLDTIIAAHALSLDVTLVTNNEREFSRVSGLKVENWIL